MENINKIIKNLSKNQKANNILFYLGIATTTYYFVKYLTKSYTNLKSRANLSKALTLYKNSSNSKNWVTLLNIDNQKNKILYYINLISKKKLNLILILRDKTSEDQIFMKNLYQITQAQKTKFRLIGYTNEEDYQNYFEQLEEEIRDVESTFFIVNNSEYNGVSPFGCDSPVLSSEDLRYVDCKVKLFTMSVVSLVKGNRTGMKLRVFLEDFRCCEGSLDFAMWESFLFFMETVGNEVRELEFKFISD